MLGAFVFKIAAGCGGQSDVWGGKLAGVMESTQAQTAKSGLREPDFFGVNTGPSDIFQQSASLIPGSENLSSFIIETMVKFSRTATAESMAGLELMENMQGGGYNSDECPLRFDGGIGRDR